MGQRPVSLFAARIGSCFCASVHTFLDRRKLETPLRLSSGVFSSGDVLLTRALSQRSPFGLAAYVAAAPRRCSLTTCGVPPHRARIGRTQDTPLHVSTQRGV